jgi:hypothetical protein
MNAANNAHREETAYLARPGLLTEMLAHGVYAIGDLLHRTLEFVGRHPELLRPVAQLPFVVDIDAVRIGLRRDFRFARRNDARKATQRVTEQASP